MDPDKQSQYLSAAEVAWRRETAQARQVIIDERNAAIAALSEIKISPESLAKIQEWFAKKDHDAYMDDLLSAMHKLRTFGTARNRASDKQMREVTITDNEAIAVLFALEHSNDEDLEQDDDEQ